MAFVGAGLTAYYMTRLYLMTFFGEYRGGHAHDDDHDGDADHHGEPHESPWLITGPLVVLAVLSLFGGLLNLPHYLPGAEKLHHFLHPVFHHSFDALAFTPNFDQEFVVAGVTMLWVFAWAGAAYKHYGKVTASEPDPHAVEPGRLWQLSHGKWFVDELYETLVLKPIHFFSRQGLWGVVDVVFIDGTVNRVGRTALALGRKYGKRLQVGQIQGYALAIAGGTVVVLFWFAVA